MAGIIRLLARLALSAIFLRSGVRALVNPDWQVKRAAQELPALPQAHVVARAQAALQVAAALALTAGVAQSAAAGALALTLIPTTYVGHPFWKMEDPQERNQHLTHFFKNLGLLGGLTLVAVPEEHRD